ncbi:hypothetical protein F2Q69_00036166 [Brassica cretica]|uniref:Uncharacterized protein n=1 Tax=Brassica cretica TaxID=69181 RepID=A0A8S9SU88_BRACR|nr:hypothetical protein F2Q69_00036166 [Brassica cretica]
MIQESLQLAKLEPSTRRTTQRRSKLTVQHRSTMIGRTNMHTDEYDEDYEEERATEYRAILDGEEDLLHHSSWKRNAPSIDMTSWADEHHHESFAVETSIYAPGEDKLQDGFTDEELLNMQRRDETDQIRAEGAWERTRFSHPIDRTIRPSIDTRRTQSIDINNTTPINNRPIPKTTVSKKDKFDNQYLTPDKFGIFRDPDGYAKAIYGHTLYVSREDIADILQTANGAHNLFMHQRNNPEQKATKESYDTTGGISKGFIQRSRHTTQPLIDIDVPTSVDRKPEFGRRAYDFYSTRRFYWEEKDKYGVYRDDQRYARDLDGHTIPVHNKDIRRLLERASRDEPAYICFLEHASLFTQTKLVLEIYTKDEINEMFYGYQLANYLHGGDEARHSQNSARDRRCSTSIDRQKKHTSIDKHHHTSIDNRMPASVDDNPPRPHTMMSQQNVYTRDEIDQLVEGIYRALETTEERLGGRCDDIYFPMDLNISALTSKIEAIQGELMEIQSYIARRPEALSSIDRRNN